jgi:4a-hydroxytetrahydrobiopterin dehydratase
MTTPQRIRRSEFHQKFHLPDWRVLKHSLVADFLATNFSSATAFVTDVAASADACEHHPDMEIRYPGTVRITLTTHGASGLTELDAALALAISQLATEHAIPVSCAQVSVLEIAIDALDIPAVIPFWKAVLGYIDEPPANPGGPVDAIVDPLRIGPSLWFQQMDGPRPQRNRIHLDLEIPHDHAQQRIDLAVAAGGKLINAESARAFWVLADPEGNEICICTWQDRD